MNPIIRRLTRISLFTGLKNDSAALAAVAAIIRIKVFKPKSYILREGEQGDAMYILNQGEVRVEKKTLSNDPFTLATLKEDMDAFFGEMALLDNEMRSASIYTTTGVECFVIQKKDFEKLCQSQPNIGYVVMREMAKSLAGRLRKTTTDTASLIAAFIHDGEM